MPFFERIGRLDIVVAIGETGGLPYRMQPISIDQWMTRSFDQSDVLRARYASVPCEGFGRATDIPGMLRQCGDGGNAQKRLQLLQKSGLLAAGKIDSG